MYGEICLKKIYRSATILCTLDLIGSSTNLQNNILLKYFVWPRPIKT